MIHRFVLPTEKDSVKRRKTTRINREDGIVQREHDSNNMSPDLSIIALIVTLLPLLSLLISIIPFQRKNKLPPSPPRLPFVGNGHQLFGSLPHRSLHSLSQRHGPVMSLLLGMVPAVVVSSADAARDIMKTYDHIFSSRPPIMAATARILFKDIDVGFANGESWRQARKLCMTHLLSSLVQSFHHIRVDEVASLLANISASSSRGVVDMSGLLSSFTNNIICRTVLGDLPMGEMDKIFCGLLVEDARLLEEFCVGDYFPFLGWLDELSGLSARTRRLARRWDDMIDELIVAHGNRPNDDANKSPSLLDALLSLQQDMTRELIKVLVHEMILGGTHTSLVTLEWCMAELVRNPEAMKKLRDETREMARGDGWVGEEHLSKMPYLKAIVKEILRLHPAAPLLLPRQATQSCQVHGYEVPAGARVLVNAWSIGRDPKVWEMPGQFRPERFLDRATDFRGQHFELIPFGAGRRICPGFQYAVFNLELALANLIHQFDWKLPDGMKPEDLSMDESPGVTLRRKERLRLLARKVLQ